MTRRGPRHPSACSFAVAIGLGALAGCSGGAAPSTDAASPRDASVVDSTLASDSGAIADAAADDASSADGGSLFCGGECDPSLSSSCSDASLACRIDAQGARCVPRGDAGAAPEGESCSAQSDCAPGLACFAQAAGTPARCLEPCCAAEGDPCGAGRRCRGNPTLADGVTSAWHACLAPVSCDLAGVEHPCADGEGCYIVDEVGTTECLPAGSSAPGQSCARPSDCHPGSVCTGLTARTCVAVCFLTSTEPRQGCADAERCQAQAYSPVGTGICTPAT